MSTDFLSFIRECTLSNTDIAEEMGVREIDVWLWRRGDTSPENAGAVIRQLSLLELSRLNWEIEQHQSKYQRKQ
jgi:hypothetical protein